MRSFWIWVFLVISTYGICGEFTKLSTHHYFYTGELERDDISTLSRLYKQDKKLIITIYSLGGSYQAGLDLGEYTKAHGIRIIVEEAYSAAGLWAIADHHMKYEDEGSFVWLHLPYNYDDDSPGELWMLKGIVLEAYLMDVVGWSREKAFYIIHEMTKLRKDYGINAGVVLCADGTVYAEHPKPEPKISNVPPIWFFPYL